MNELLLTIITGGSCGAAGWMVTSWYWARREQQLLPSVVCHSCDYAERQVPWFHAITAWRHHAEYTHHNVELQAGGQHA